jgi:hypothetical protein
MYVNLVLGLHWVTETTQQNYQTEPVLDLMLHTAEHGDKSLPPALCIDRAYTVEQVR